MAFLCVAVNLNEHGIVNIVAEGILDGAQIAESAAFRSRETAGQRHVPGIRLERNTCPAICWTLHS